MCNVLKMLTTLVITSSRLAKPSVSWILSQKSKTPNQISSLIYRLLGARFSNINWKERVNIVNKHNIKKSLDSVISTFWNCLLMVEFNITIQLVILWLNTQFSLEPYVFYLYNKNMYVLEFEEAIKSPSMIFLSHWQGRHSSWLLWVDANKYRAY